MQLQGSTVSLLGNNIFLKRWATLRLAWVIQFPHFPMTNWPPASYSAVNFLAAHAGG